MMNKKTSDDIIKVAIATLFIIAIVFVVEKFPSRCESSSVNIIQQNSSLDKIDLGYDLETNQTYWKYPNETIWKMCKGVLGNETNQPKGCL